MTKEFWINLPVKDMPKARAFYKQLGFTLHGRFGENDNMAGLVMGDNKVMVMLATEGLFQSFSGNAISDTKQGTEVLLSIDAESREEVDEMAKNAAAAGGTVYAQPGESQGWLYGCGFIDLDGHRWNPLYRDMDKMPKG